jgi:hypothetical protein
VIAQDPRGGETVLVPAAQSVLLPGESHGKAKDRQVDVGHAGAILHLGRATAYRTRRVLHHLFDHQGHFRSPAFVVQHPHVFQPNEGFEDFGRVRQDEGVFNLFSHNYN